MDLVYLFIPLFFVHPIMAVCWLLAPDTLRAFPLFFVLAVVGISYRFFLRGD